MPCPFFHTFNFPKLQVLRALASLRSLSVLPDNLRRHASLSLSCQMPLLFPQPTHTILRVKCASMQRNRWVALLRVSILQHTSAYVSIRQHTSAYVSIRQHTSEYSARAPDTDRNRQRHDSDRKEAMARRRTFQCVGSGVNWFTSV